MNSYLYYSCFIVIWALFTELWWKLWRSKSMTRIPWHGRWSSIVARCIGRGLARWMAGGYNQLIALHGLWEQIGCSDGVLFKSRHTGMTVVLVLMRKGHCQLELLSTNLAIYYVAFVEFALCHSKGISFFQAIVVVLCFILYHRILFVWIDTQSRL